MRSTGLHFASESTPVDSLGCIQGTVSSTWLLQSLADLTPPAAEVDLAAD